MCFQHCSIFSEILIVILPRYITIQHAKMRLHQWYYTLSSLAEMLLLLPCIFLELIALAFFPGVGN